MSPQLQTISLSSRPALVAASGLAEHAQASGLPPVDTAPSVDIGSSALPTCLLVDHDLRGDLSPLLAGRNALWLHAASASAARALLLQHAPIALACVDGRSVGADSTALMDELQAAGAAVLLVADAGAALPAGAAGITVLPRPLAPGALESCVDQTLALRQQQLVLLQDRRACDDAIRLNAMVADVLGHDLRSPLSAILMSAEILKRRPDEALQKTGARLARSALWMGRMVQDMLDLTRSQLGQRMQLQPVPVDLSGLLQSVLDERAAAFPDHPIQAMQLGNLHGVWDSARLRQLLSGLVGNAVHHGEPGQPVSVQLDGQAADTLQFSVRNHGAIDAALLPHLFDPLHGMGRRPGAPEGLGFGLAIARQIARAHGGELTVQSDARSGTLAQLTLPRLTPAAATGG